MKTMTGPCHTSVNLPYYIGVTNRITTRSITSEYQTNMYRKSPASFHGARLALLPVLCTAPVYAADNIRYLGIASDNDNYLSRNDRHYSNALRLWMGVSGREPAKWRDWLADFIPLDHDPATREFTLSLGHSLYTPENLASPFPQPDDRPFAGWLYGELAVTAYRSGIQETLAVNAGVVGPAALGRQAQETLHDITGDVEPRGWRNQLGNEPALLLRYSRSWFPVTEQNRNMDIVPGAGASLGNVVTQASASVTIRFGNHLQEQHTPVDIQPSFSAPGGPFRSRRDHTDWMLHMTAGARLVAHNIFLDGNTFRDSFSVHRKPLVWHVAAGFDLTFGHSSLPVRLGFRAVLEGKEFHGQAHLDRHGSVNITIRY